VGALAHVQSVVGREDKVGGLELAVRRHEGMRGVHNVVDRAQRAQPVAEDRVDLFGLVSL
jgi:hypothetical protein